MAPPDATRAHLDPRLDLAEGLVEEVDGALGKIRRLVPVEPLLDFIEGGVDHPLSDRQGRSKYGTKKGK